MRMKSDIDFRSSRCCVPFCNSLQSIADHAAPRKPAQRKTAREDPAPLLDIER
jgi:hypothetical protein